MLALADERRVETEALEKVVDTLEKILSGEIMVV
jgi:RNA binding exosome subunit